MSYETEEQQLERLKEWWNDNGTPLIVGAVLGLAGFAGWKFWNHQQIAYQEGASDLYIKVTEVIKNDDKQGLAESALAVKQKYPDSSYAIFSAFHLAKLAVEANELDKAVAELSWVLENHATNELAVVAKIRLARVLIEQQKASQALPLLELEEDSGYYALANLAKGDALLALERRDEALVAYKAASSDASIAARHPSLAIKINQLSAIQGQVIDNQPKEIKADGTQAQLNESESVQTSAIESNEAETENIPASKESE